MSIFSDNLKFLRIKKKLTQTFVAEEIGIKRDRYAKYEEGAQPPFDIMINISRFHMLSLDMLITAKLSSTDFERAVVVGNRIILPIIVNDKQEDNIEVVSVKAKMGYVRGLGDPEFIESLQRLSLPFLRNGKFRAFPVTGDSMPPHRDSSYVIGRYVEELGHVMDGKTYILVTNDDIVYKRLNKNGKNQFDAISDNVKYSPYQVKFSEIREIWEFACSIALEEFEEEDDKFITLKDTLDSMRLDIAALKKGIH